MIGPPQPFEVKIEGATMSGLISVAEEPRAVIVALHGGATTPEYYDAPGHPRHSLLRLGAALGLTVVAPDRPGYGASRGMMGDDVSPARQVDMTFAGLHEVLKHREKGAGLFLLGHSQGCVLAMRMAADPRGSAILGLEIAGTGVELNARAHSARRAARQGGERSGLRNLLWEPAYLYEGRSRVLSSAPAFEGVDASTWPTEFAVLAPEISVPVRISLGDHEFWWQEPPAGLSAMANLFVRSERVVTHEQYQSGHNTSLGISALAYHLTTIAFVEECLLTHDRISGEHTEMEIFNA
ncbi:alpha/beta hydrolase [Rhodococcus sp. P1Y]|uniref:alpha/beta hydrolase n=1 Tax=Rhodococcus sp. P1Y TaxID=1302308 RepID=UPI000EB0825B|nr:alpha/beta hydrolase [Rhodococcus sp. P1Y]AYJ50337.1 alpha/beta hydrolase [Rhodococcus sp. P1Y]